MLIDCYVKLNADPNEERLHRDRQTDSPPLTPMRPRDDQEEDVMVMTPIVTTSRPSVPPPLSIDDNIRESNIDVYQKAGDRNHGGGRNITNSIVFTDASVIECPICNQTFTDEIFDNKPFGCQKFLPVVGRLTHETTDCVHQPYTCPYPHCGFSSSSPGDLYTHFRNSHPSQCVYPDILRFTFGSPICFRGVADTTPSFLQEANDGVIFVFNQSIEENGRHFEVQCIGSPILHGDAFRCSLEMECPEINYTLNCTPTVCRQWVSRPPQNNFLIVPDACGKVSLGTLLITKKE